MTDSKTQTSPLAQRALTQIPPHPSADEINDAALWSTLKIYDGLISPGTRVTLKSALEEYQKIKDIYAKHRSLPGEYHENMAKSHKEAIEAVQEALPPTYW